jgi:hypothetical protein
MPRGTGIVAWLRHTQKSDQGESGGLVFCREDGEQGGCPNPNAVATWVRKMSPQRPDATSDGLSSP